MTISKHKLLTMAVLVFTSIPLSGCGIIGMFDTRQPIDIKADESGKRWVLDTQKNWYDWKIIMDTNIERESQGVAKKGGMTWHRFWKNRIKALQEAQVNPHKYINYIITTRRARGLPEL